jgi:formylmethanofuran dehydrogenase subunit B
MALKVICDGCGQPLEDGEVTVHGLVISRQYCGNCAATAEQFSSDRDALHTAVTKKWDDGFKKLIKDFSKANPDFILPDVNV